LCEFSRSGPVFPILQGTLPWQPIKVKKISVFYRPIYFIALPFRNGLQFRFQKIRENEFLCILCTILVTFGPETSEFTVLTIAPFVAIWQKSAYHANYLRMFWTYLDLLYRFGRRISGDDFPNIHLMVAQGTLLWQPVKYGRCSQTSHGTNLLFASAFDKGLADHKSAFKRFNGNNHATSCPNLVNFRPVISEFMLLKLAIFATICPQFDDDLHSSGWCFQTEWKIAILILGG